VEGAIQNHLNEHAAHLVILGISSMIVAICVMLHYEALRFLSLTLGTHVHKGIGVSLVMMGLLIAHFLEVRVFAIAHMFVEHEMGLPNCRRHNR
jgi:hypothetical protein